MFLMNWIHGSMMNLTGLYHAIRNATGTAVTKPIRKPSNTEIKLLPISLNSKPLETIVWMEPITLIAFGKHLDVLGMIDKTVHNINATTNEISSQTPFGIFPTKSAPLLFLPVLKNLHLKFCL